MRIHKIHVNGFGALQQRTYETGSQVVLFYGANEAGKSTLMGFIRSVLFGFAGRGRPDRFEPARGGAHGGYLLLSDEQGRMIRVERGDGGFVGTGPGPIRGRSGGTLRVVLEDGTAGGEELLRPLLGAISAELFRHIFAFGLSELQEIRTLQSEELGGYLYHAALGASGSGRHTIPDAERKLEQEMDRLYRPRGQNQDMNVLLKEIEELETKTARSRESIGRFNDMTGELEELEQQLTRSEAELGVFRSRLTVYENAIQSQERWMRLREIELQLAELPVFAHFPANALSRYDAARMEHVQVTEELRRLNDKFERLNAELRETLWDEALFTDREAFARLLERLGSYEEGLYAEAALHRDIAHLDEQLLHELRSIDDTWTEETLMNFPLGTAQREYVRVCRERTSEWRKERDRLRHALDELGRQVLEARHKQKRSEAELAAGLSKQEDVFGWVRPQRPETFQQSLAELRKAVERWRQARTEHDMFATRIEDVRRSIEAMTPKSVAEAASLPSRGKAGKSATKGQNPFRHILLAGAGLTIAAPTALWLAGEREAGLIGFIVLLAVNLILFAQGEWIKRRIELTADTRHETAGSDHGERQWLADLRRQTDELEVERQRAGLRLQQAKTSAGTVLSSLVAERSPTATQTAADAERHAAIWAYVAAGSAEGSVGGHDEQQLAGLEELQQSLALYAGQMTEHLHSEQLHREHERALQLLTERKELLQQQYDELDRSHYRNMAEWNSWLADCSLPPDLSEDAVLDIFRHAEQAWSYARQKMRENQKSEQLSAQLREFALEAGRLLGDSDGAAGQRLIAGIKQREMELERQAETRARHTQISGIVAELAEEIAVLQAKETTARESITRIWEEAGAVDEQQFFQHHEQDGLRHRLLDERRHIDVFFETWVGEEQKDELFALLHANTGETLLREAERLRYAIACCEEETNGLKDRRGRLCNELEKLESAAERIDDAQRLEEKVTELQQAARRWGTLALCAGLVRATKDYYEREKQPGVLKGASAYLSDLTGGRYRGIMVPFGKQTIVVERNDGDLLESALLSRGTAEQLYLAMRCALADEYGKSVTLPLIMDDIFVNFDGDRLRRVVSLLPRLSERRQLLLFTCHTHVRDEIMRTIPDCLLYELTRTSSK